MANFWEKDAIAPRQAIPGGLPAGAIQLGPPDPKYPFEAPQAAATLGVTQVNAAKGVAELPYAATKARAEATKAQAEAEVAQITARQGGQGKNLSPEVREKAIGAYRSAQGLEDRIGEIERAFAAGPGATSGIAGIRDFLPTEANRVFNDAGNSARAFGGPVLGFTASQLNTEKEQQRAMGPYIPQASDYDTQITAKIARLHDLVNMGRDRSVQILGGIPDASGNIARTTGQRQDPALPAAGGNPPPPGAGGGPPSSGNAPPPPGNGPAMSLATGGVRTAFDPQLSSQVEQAIRQGASADDIRARFPGVEPDQGQVSAVQAYLKTHPDYKGFTQVTRQEQNGVLNRLAASPVGAYFANAGDAIVPFGAVLSPQQRAAFEQSREENPTASLIGSLAGGIGASAGMEVGLARGIPALGRMAAPAADALYGAIQGAGNADEGSGALGAVEGAGAGLLGGVVGRGVARGAGRVMRGLDNPAVAYLRGEGVPVTVGQALGGTAKTIEDQSTGYPIVGGVIKARRDEGLTGFNRAMFRQAGEGADIPNIGERGAEQLDQVVNQAYAPLDNARLQMDDPFAIDLLNAQAGAHGIPGRADDFDFTMDRRVAPNIDPSGQIGGRDAQDMVRGLRSDAAGQTIANNHPEAFAQSLGEVGDAVRDLVGRQDPAALDALDQGNRIYRNQRIVDEAVKAARNTRGPEGDALVMPSQLNAASVSGTNAFGGRNAAATTERPFYDLATNGQDVLPSKVGDSGSAGRLALAGLATAATTGGGLYGASDGGGAEGAGIGSLSGLAGLTALAAVGGARPTQRMLVSLLADRPDLARRIGNQIYNRAAIPGVVGVPLGIDLQSELAR